MNPSHPAVLCPRTKEFTLYSISGRKYLCISAVLHEPLTPTLAQRTLFGCETDLSTAVTEFAHDAVFPPQTATEDRLTKGGSVQQNIGQAVTC